MSPNQGLPLVASLYHEKYVTTQSSHVSAIAYGNSKGWGSTMKSPRTENPGGGGSSWEKTSVVYEYFLEPHITISNTQKGCPVRLEASYQLIYH